MLDLDSVKKRYDLAKLAEDSKDKIVEELLTHIHVLREELQHEKDELEDQRRLARDYKEDARTLESRLDEKSRMEAELKFALVLVDGDHMNFMNELVNEGQKGGCSAAKALIETSRDHIQKVKEDSSPNMHYKIKVYANVAGLAKTYSDLGLVSSADTVRDFIRGFNMENTLCEFVDAGCGKECSDVKIGAQLEHNLRDIHCQHVIFCGSADNGYARILRSHRGSNRISLVEGPPFASELRELIPEFETTSFPAVFRSKKLSKASFSTTKGIRTITPPRTPTTDYACVAKTALENSPPLENTNTSSKIRIPQRPVLVVDRNSKNERIDSLLRPSGKEKLHVLKHHKFCNQFQILGSCSYGDSCDFKHVPVLVNHQDVVDLMWIARLSACPKGLKCNDRNCLGGHRCPQNDQCPRRGCKFPHDVDML